MHKVGELVYYELHGLGTIIKIMEQEVVDERLQNWFNENPYVVEWFKDGITQYFKENEITMMKGYLKDHAKP
jgi:RNA polymerase-interacting CarD/CdnL/TRCF family regulator